MTKSLNDIEQSKNSILNFIDEGLSVIDKNFFIKDTNSWVLEHFGLEEIRPNQHCYEVFRNRSTPCDFCPAAQTFKTGKSYKEILNNPFNEDTSKWYSLVSYPIIDKNNKITAVIENLRDITETKLTEQKLLQKNDEFKILNRQLKNYSQKLEESETRYKTLYNNAPLAYQSTDMEGNLIDVNPQWCKMLGYSKEEVIGEKFENFIHDDEKKNVNICFEKFEISGFVKDLHYTMKHKDGHYLQVAFEGNIGKNSDGTSKQTYCTFKDKTEEQKTQEELNNSRNQLEKLFQVAPTGIGIIKNRIIVDVNIEITNMTGYTSEDLIGQSARIFYPDDEQYNFVGHERNHQINQNETCRIETKWETKEGKILNIILSSTPLDLKDLSKGLIFTALDITERKNNEESLKIKNNAYEQLNEELKLTNEKLITAKDKAIESNHLKSEFLHNMSHEIRTPMNGIIGFSDMLQDPDISNQKKNFYAKIIKSSSHQLLRIIDDILEISRLETKQVKAQNEPVNLNDLLMEQFSIFSLKAKERQIPLYVRKGLSYNNCTLITDKSKLNKIIQNLVENALKFTTNGFIEMGYHATETELQIYVKDTGVGISEKNLKNIFERFSQEEKSISREQGGLGLGLSISQENAEVIGGHITVESVKGKGSTFTINLPFIKPIVSPLKKGEVANNKQNKFTVIVAEDEEINYLFLETVLNEIENVNIKILHAFNGQEAVEMFKKNEIDLILMDIKMPVMNGDQATRIIKSLNPEIPIIAQTAYVTEIDKIKAKDVGYDDYLTKPINQTTLLRIIDLHMKNKQKKMLKGNKLGTNTQDI